MRSLWASAAQPLLAERSQAGQQHTAHMASATSPSATLQGWLTGPSPFCFTRILLGSRGMQDAPCWAFLCLSALPFLFGCRRHCGNWENTRCVQAGSLPPLERSLPVVPGGDEKLLPLPVAGCTLGAAVCHVPAPALSPFKLILHLFQSQPAFIFQAFRNLGSRGYLRFAYSE